MYLLLCVMRWHFPFLSSQRQHFPSFRWTFSYMNTQCGYIHSISDLYSSLPLVAESIPFRVESQVQWLQAVKFYVKHISHITQSRVYMHYYEWIIISIPPVCAQTHTAMAWLDLTWLDASDLDSFFAMLKLCPFNVCACVCRFFLPLIPIFVDEYVEQIFIKFSLQRMLELPLTSPYACSCDERVCVRVRVRVLVFSRMWDFCHLDASSHTRSHMRVVFKTELCCVQFETHCLAVLLWVCTKRQSVFTLSLSLRLNYVMWHCKCECITESHIHPSKRLSIVRLSVLLKRH